MWENSSKFKSCSYDIRKISKLYLKTCPIVAGSHTEWLTIEQFIGYYIESISEIGCQRLNGKFELHDGKSKYEKRSEFRCGQSLHTSFDISQK